MSYLEYRERPLCILCQKEFDENLELYSHLRYFHDIPVDTPLYKRLSFYGVLKDPKKYLNDIALNVTGFFGEMLSGEIRRYVEYGDITGYRDFKTSSGLEFLMQSRNLGNDVKSRRGDYKKKNPEHYDNLSKRFKKNRELGLLKPIQDLTSEQKMEQLIKRKRSYFYRKGTPELFYPWMIKYLAEKNKVSSDQLKTEVLEAIKDDSVKTDQL